MKTLEDFIYPTQKKLFKTLRDKYRGRKVFFADNSFILIRGAAPVMLVAHLDTVHKNPVKVICKSDDGNILMSPQGIGGDDRCGVYALAKIYELSEVKPHLLFTCDEEIGGGGAKWFCKAHTEGKLPSELDSLKFLVEIDRRGSNDAVFYDCANPDFEDSLLQFGFRYAHGSFSDISVIAPELKVAAVNLSSGYHNAHTLHEYIVRSELETTIEKTLEIVKWATRKDTPRFEYIDAAQYLDDERFYSCEDLFHDFREKDMSLFGK